MSNLFILLINALVYVLNDVASSRASRYVMNAKAIIGETVEIAVQTDVDEDGTPVIEPVPVPETLARVVCTFLAILSKRSRTSMIQVGEDQKPISQYQFPEHWWDLAHARRVYASDSAVDRVSPMFEIEGKIPSGVKLMFPEQVESFFREFNSYQADGQKVRMCVAPESFDSYAVLSELKAVWLCEEEMIAPLFESGVLAEEATQALELDVGLDADVLTAASPVSQEVLKRWLVSIG